MKTALSASLWPNLAAPFMAMTLGYCMLLPFRARVVSQGALLITMCLCVGTLSVLCCAEPIRFLWEMPDPFVDPSNLIGNTIAGLIIAVSARGVLSILPQRDFGRATFWLSLSSIALLWTCLKLHQGIVWRDTLAERGCANPKADKAIGGVSE
jgi:hypothetical protein